MTVSFRFVIEVVVALSDIGVSGGRLVSLLPKNYTRNSIYASITSPIVDGLRLTWRAGFHETGHRGTWEGVSVSLV